MKRVPEPELMDDDEQAAAYHQADFSEPHTHFVAQFRKHFPAGSWSGPVLDLGCGTADVTLRFAEAFEHIRIDGIDGAESMLRLGRKEVSRRGLSERVRLSRVHLPVEHPPLARYGAVISNSLLHHLCDPMTLWASIRAYAAASAPVLVMDLLRPSGADQVDALVARYASGAPERLRCDFRNSLCAGYSFAEVHEQLAMAGLDHLTAEIVSDRHFVVTGRMR